MNALKHGMYGALMAMVAIVSLPSMAQNGGNRLSGLWPATNVTQSNLNVSKDTLLTGQNITSIANVDPGNIKHMLNIDATGNGITSVDSTPVIDAHGNVYIATGGGSIISYTRNGDLRWKRDLLDDTGNAEFFDESPLLAGGAVFIAGRMLHKLNMKNGSDLATPLVFNSKTAPFLPPYIPSIARCPFATVLPSQLMLAGDKVIYAVGYSDEDTCGTELYPYSHGQLIAVNAFDDNGLSVAWNIDLTTIGPDGKPVLDAQGNPVSYGAGVTSFGGGGVDRARHLFFIGTGNEYADPNNPGAGVPGAPGNNISPISDSLIAVNYNTGKIAWFYQYLANDIFGGGSAQYQATFGGRLDLDVHGHPQIFSVLDSDFVGSRGKDGSYRIFYRDQTPGHVTPIAQIQLDPPNTEGGGIQVDPVIAHGILYIASTAWIENAATDIFDPALFPSPSPYTVVNGRRTSIDILGSASGSSILGGSLFATTTVRAIDLEKLIVYGAQQLQQGITRPICVGTPNSMFNPNTTINGDPLCVGQLPDDIILWTQAIKPLFPMASSGMTYDNGVLIIGGFEGVLILIDANNNGAVISSPSTNPVIPVPFSSDPAVPSDVAQSFSAYGIQGVPILGGVSTANGQLFIPTGFAFPSSTSPLAAYGGLVIYQSSAASWYLRDRWR